MRAWQVTRHGEPRDALRCVETRAPEPDSGQLRLAVAAAGVGYPDLAMCRGGYALTPALPFTPGQEVVGTVVAANGSVHCRPGQRVMAISAFFTGHGGFAEQCLALDDFAFPVPEGMEDAEAAAFLIPFHTAHLGLVRRAALRAGETLLVLGASGGTGSAALQLGRAIGAHVIAVCGGGEKVEFCRDLGADRVIDRRRDDITEAVRDATQGRGADVVYDPVGGDAFEAATRCMAHEGRLLAVGFASGRWGQPSTAHLVAHNYSVLGVMPGGYDWKSRQDTQDALIAHWGARRLRVPVCEVVAFDSLALGLERLGAQQVTGKLVLRVTVD